MDIPNAIVSIRESKNIKQVEIAQKLGIEQSNYSRFEKRGNKLTIEQLMSIAQALDVSIIDILTWGEERRSEEGLRKQVADLRERNEELQILVDLQRELTQMRKLTAKRYYEEYNKIIQTVQDSPTPEFQALQLMVEFIAVLGDISDDK